MREEEVLRKYVERRQVDYVGNKMEIQGKGRIRRQDIYRIRLNDKVVGN